jgi:hypothetical protein
MCASQNMPSYVFYPPLLPKLEKREGIMHGYINAKDLEISVNIERI